MIVSGSRRACPVSGPARYTQGSEEPQAVSSELAHAAEEHQDANEWVANGYHAGKGKLL